MKYIFFSNKTPLAKLHFSVFSLAAATFVLLYSPAAVFAQTGDATQQLSPFNVTIPGIGRTIQVDQQMIQTTAIAASVFIFFIFLLGVVLFFLSVFRRYKRVPRDKALLFGWNGVRNNIPFFVGVSLLFLACSNLLFILTRVGASINPSFVRDIQVSRWYVLASIIIGFLLTSYAAAGTISIALRYSENGEKAFRAFFVAPMQYIHFLIANILYTLGLLIGSVVFVIPAAWFGSRFFFWPYLILSKKISFIAAFRESKRMSKGATVEVFLFWFLSVMITTLGIVVVGIGYLFILPMVALATVYVYKQMDKRCQE
ncbi:hypothetical protein HY732_04475 [Candidatus Uhrbacteria bacterium]|nr:hypothetical protein [Candidatus Uhrbacteria bacterium]